MNTCTKKGIGAAAIVIVTGLGTCQLEARKFQSRATAISLPCTRLDLPNVAGANVLTENLCVSISGDQPQRVGVERVELSGGRSANTFFMEWNYDGFTEWARKTRPDAEPVTIIADANGRAVTVQVRSHWRVGVYPVEQCRQSDGKVRVAITNAFHTPLVVGCTGRNTGRVVDPNNRGGINTIIYGIVADWARAVGQGEIGFFNSLNSSTRNELPGPNHPARTQPIYWPGR